MSLTSRHIFQCGRRHTPRPRNTTSARLYRRDRTLSEEKQKFHFPRVSCTIRVGRFQSLKNLPLSTRFMHRTRGPFSVTEPFPSLSTGFMHHTRGTFSIIEIVSHCPWVALNLGTFSNKRKHVANSIPCSHAVTHQGTIGTRRCLTAGS